MYDSLRDKEVDDALLSKTDCCLADAVINKGKNVCSCCGMPAGYLKAIKEKSTREIKPMTKEMQIGAGRMKPKKESTFGKPSTKGTFGKVNKKTKVKKSDVIDEKYLKWLAQKGCVVTGLKAQRGIGADNIHIHHIYSRNKGRNDYKAVPLMGFAHSWGGTAYHSNTKDDYIKKHKLIIEDIIEYFEDCANDFVNEYIEQGNELKQ